MKYCLALFLLVLSVSHIQAQSQNESKGIVYQKEWSLGGMLHTQGWGFFYEKARYINFRNKKIFEIQFTQLKNPKETRQASDYGYSYLGQQAPRPFVYGKQNNFYPLNVAIGRQHMFAERAEKSGVEVGFKYMGGISIGILKPYYLDLISKGDNQLYTVVKPERYSSDNANRFLDLGYIYGSSGFTYGLDQINVIPGLHLQAALNFDWATNDQFVKALEAGVIFDAYYKKIPIMIQAANYQFCPNLYVSLQFGKKH